MPFVKLDCGILDSTIWEDREAREVFITALLMARPVTLEGPQPELEAFSPDPTGWEVPAGEYGLVKAPARGIIRRACIDPELGAQAIARLSSPEQDSRTPDHDGRRMVRIAEGFIVLNFNKYREKDTTAAIRAKRYRDKARHAVTSRENEGSLRIASASASASGSEEGVQGEPKPDRFMASFAPKSTKREDVQRVHRAWIKSFRLPHNTPLVRGYSTDDADAIAAAVDTYGEADCVTMLRYAPNDGMVSGRADERGLKHESIRYLFGDNLPRLMRDALAAKERRTGAGSAEAIERRKAAP